MFSFLKKICGHKNQIFIRDFVANVEIGVNAEEKGRKQKILLNIVFEPKSWPKTSNDNINETVSYDDVVKIVQNISDQGHIHLLETFAEKISKTCLDSLPIKKITVSVEKHDIYSFAVPGVRVTRTK